MYNNSYSLNLGNRKTSNRKLYSPNLASKKDAYEGVIMYYFKVSKFLIMKKIKEYITKDQF